MNEDFVDFANNLQNECLLKSEAHFITHKQSCLIAFKNHFQAVCAAIVKAQNESILPGISHLEYTMKYANFINRRYIAEVWVYGEGWYLNEDQRMIGEYDVSPLFVHFDELWDKLLAQRKRFGGKVSSQEVTSAMIQSLPKFYSYLTNIARFAIVDCVDEKQFADIVKNDTFKVRVGDYMAKTEPVFTLKKNKNADELVLSFSERDRYDYIFEDCSDLDFSSRDFSNTVFRYVQFRRTILNNASLDSCSLIGASFYKTQLENCCLDHSAVYEADFSYANMKNSSLVNVRGKAGLPNKSEWQHVGFLPVSFKNADLSGANFKWANLTGADFSGANLAGANFTCAVLDDVIFANAVLDGVDFTGTVLKGVNLADLKHKKTDISDQVMKRADFSSISKKPEFMHYYVIEPTGTVLLPAVPKSEKSDLVFTSDLSSFSDIDYDSRSDLISERLKLLIERYMPDYEFESVIYYDKAKAEQLIYWRFRPPLYEDFQAAYRSDGIVSQISCPIPKAPIVFTARSPKGVRSVIVRMAVAESILRRSILGLKLTKIHLL
jgi:uncharacterized protein YjbI with pentapeptide repeats